MGMELFQIDAFTDKPFSGNPAAVCLLEKPMEAKWMQSVAAEMNLSDTAFLLKNGIGYDLRWFTPAVEVDLCGHATLASAHFLWEQGHCSGGAPITFFTQSGNLRAERHDNWIELDFPMIPQSPVPAPKELREALRTEPVYVGRKGRADYLVEVSSESILRSLTPDMAILKKIAQGVAVTSRSERKEFDFVSRYFAPREGINEDPVTGSAHCCLGPYWKEKLGKGEFLAYQASERGGLLRVKVGAERVKLGGQAVTVIRGTLTC
jgi:PhzF family phenazine biosynthesis protein